MAPVPAPTHSTTRRIYQLHEQRRDDKPRPYLGASQIGEACARKLWLSFRWAGAEQFEGRMLRLFQRGEQEEVQLFGELRAIGVQIEGEQHAVQACGGHFRGHLDGAGLGFEEGPKTWAVIEVKTSNAKGFKEIQSKGCQVAKPLHWAQMQAYMGLTGMTRAMYFVTNKETDEIYEERLHFDKDAFDNLMAKAERIVFAAEPPPKISDDPSWFACRFCPFHAQCHGEARAAVTCRSCAHSTPTATGEWHCAQFDVPIPEDMQREGCGEHRYIPVLLERVAELQTAEGNNLRWKNLLTGHTFDQPMYSSKEMHDAADFRVVGDEFLQEYKTVFGHDTRITSTPVAPESGDFKTDPADLKAVYGKQSAVRRNAAVRPGRVRAA